MCFQKVVFWSLAMLWTSSLGAPEPSASEAAQVKKESAIPADKEALATDLAKIFAPTYQVVKFLGAGGESEVFLVKDKADKLFAAKYWTPQKTHNHLRGTTPFQNAVDAYKALSQTPHEHLELFLVIGDDLSVL